MREECTLFLSTYDGGEDLWEGFFKALSTQWPDMDMKIVMNTETKSYQYGDFEIEAYAPCRDHNLTWAERLVESLKHVKTEFVLLFLEDFWLDKKVDDLFFRKTLEWMKENDDIANFSYYPCMPGTNIQDGRYDRFELRPQRCEYKFNCQVGLWRTKELISFFRMHEDPWEWELYGSIRAGRCKKKFYCLREDADLIFSYGDNLTGCIVHRGKWVKEAVLPLADLYGLNIDYDVRGFENFDELRAERNMSKWERVRKEHIWPILKIKIYQAYRRWLSTRRLPNQL